MSKHLVTDPDEILKLLLDDPAFTEAADRDRKGVYITGGDGTKRYITQLEMEDGPLPDSPTEPEAKEFDMCPMGCGRTTDDPYGGPCSKCWDKAS